MKKAKSTSYPGSDKVFGKDFVKKKNNVTYHNASIEGDEDENEGTDNPNE